MDDHVQNTYWQEFKRIMGDEGAEPPDSEVLDRLRSNTTRAVNLEVAAQLPELPPIDEYLSNWSRKIREQQARNPPITAIIVHALCPPRWCKPLYRTDGTVHVYISADVWNAALMWPGGIHSEHSGFKVLGMNGLPSVMAVPVVHQGFDV